MKRNAIRLAQEVLRSRRKRADGGTDEWQSTGKLINEDESINWGNPDVASDFFRAAKEDLRRRQEAEREEKLDRSDVTASIPPAKTSEGRQMAQARPAPPKAEEPAPEAPAPAAAPSVAPAPPEQRQPSPVMAGATPPLSSDLDRGPMPPAMQAVANRYSPRDYQEALTDEQRQALALEQWKAAGRSGTPDNPNPSPPPAAPAPIVQASLTTPAPQQTATDANRQPLRFAPTEKAEPAAPNAPTSAILAAIRFNESRNKPTAQNPRSSAGGLYQFLDSTWGSTLRRMDPQQFGRYSDRQLRSLKTDPRYVDLQHSAAEFLLTKDIAPRLEKAGIPLTPGSAYLSWFQGPAGAIKTYTAPDNATVAQVFPRTVAANSNMRFNGKPYANWTMSDLRQWADTKMAQRMQPVRQPLRFGPAEGYEEGGRVGYANTGAVDDQPMDVGYVDPMGVVAYAPSAPEGAKESLYDRAMQSLRPPEDSRIWEGMKRGFGEQPLGGHERPQDIEFRKEHPSISAAYDSLMKPAAAVMRAPGAIIGGLAGAGASAYEAMGAPGGDQSLSPEARANRLERDLFALGNVGIMEAGNVRPKAPTYTDAIPRGGDVLPPLPREALAAPERAAPTTIEGNPAALEAPRKALPAPTIAETAMEKVPEVAPPPAEPVAPAVEKAKETLQPLRQTGDNNPPLSFSPVDPEGNLNFRPSITAEQLKGPDRQTVESFIAQLRGKPGFTADSIAEIASNFESPKTVVSKEIFERSIPSSKFDRVDLINKPESLDEFNQMVHDEFEQYVPETFMEFFADNYDIGLDATDAEMLTDFHRGVLPFEELPQEVLDALEEHHILTADDLMANLEEAYDERYNSLHQRMMEAEGLDEFSFSGDQYKYQDNQRLLADPGAYSHQYKEFGLTHPDIQDDSYYHMPHYSGENPLGGHWRRTKMPESGELITGSIDMGNVDNDWTLRNPVYLKTEPNSTVIEEIQSDIQQSEKQTGPLRQIHGTIFKAAIQEALENGSTTVYMPTFKAISSVRSLSSDAKKTLARIYDQEIVKDGIQPLSKIPGVTITKVADGAYRKIDFTPDAINYILKGPGQRSPGHARGGTVDRAMNISQFGTDAVQTAVNLARQHRGRPENPRSTS